MNNISDNPCTLKPMDRENKFLNFLKGIGCICVVFIHFPFPGVFGLIVKRLSFFAVSIFFMISGYFAYNCDVSSSQDAILRRLKKICRTTLWACGFYFVYVVLFNIAKHNAIEFLGRFFAVKTLVDFVVINNFEIIDAYHLWFLPSLIYAYCILLILQKKHLVISSYKILPVLFAIKIITEIIVETLGLSYHWRCNVFIGALPYVLLGNYIAYREKEIGALRSKNEIIGILLSVTATILLTIFYSGWGGGWWICIAILSISLFLLAVKNPDVTIIKAIHKVGIDYSLYVYVFHVIVYRVISNVFLIMGLSKCIIIQWVTPVIVAMSSIIWAMILRYFCKKKRRLLN